jgi:hypothetical protein
MFYILLGLKQINKKQICFTYIPEVMYEDGTIEQILTSFYPVAGE